MCPIHGTAPEWVEEKNWFFRLSAYAGPAARALRRAARVRPAACPLQRGAGVHRGRPRGHLPVARLDRVGRARALGPRPGHLRLDRRALNYTSALTYARPGEDLTDRFWPARWQVLGKDILKFHAVIWPAMLMAAGLDVPQQLLIHGSSLCAGEDVEVGRQRARSVPRDRAVRARRAAVLPVPRRAIRRRRRRLVRARPRSLSTWSWPTTSATSCRRTVAMTGRFGTVLAPYRHRGPPPPRDPGAFERQVRGARRPVRADRGARGGLGAASAR